MKTMVMDDAAALWSEYMADHSNEQRRNKLVEHYLTWAQHVSRKMAKRLPGSTEDYEAAGAFGLIDAVTRYDPTTGVPFQAYALLRIRGAVKDEFRTLDTASRLERQHHVAHLKAQAMLRQKLCREPTQQEIDDEMTLVPLAAILPDCVAMLDDPIDRERSIAPSKVTALLASFPRIVLTDDERIALVLHLRGLNQEYIALVLDCATGRVANLISWALAKFEGTDFSVRVTQAQYRAPAERVLHACFS